MPPLTHKRAFVRDQILDLIEGMEPGAAIPPERQLCQELNVARVTLRKAVTELVREGRLERRHGSGTYVALPKPNRLLTVASFSEDALRRGKVPTSRSLESTSIPAGARLSRRLDVSPQDTVLVFRRLRLVDNVPMAIETLHVPSDLVPGLQAADLEQHSFYRLLEERYGIVVTHGRQTIEPTVLDGEEARLLNVPLLSPAFLFELTTTADGRTVEFVRSIHRGDSFKLQVDLEPRHEAFPWPNENGKGDVLRIA